MIDPFSPKHFGKAPPLRAYFNSPCNISLQIPPSFCPQDPPTPIRPQISKDPFFLLQGHYVLSESQPELEEKQASALSGGVQVQPTAHSDLDPQTTSQQQPTQYIITTTTNGNGSREVHITKP